MDSDVLLVLYICVCVYVYVYVHIHTHTDANMTEDLNTFIVVFSVFWGLGVEPRDSDHSTMKLHPMPLILFGDSLAILARQD